MTTTTSNFIMFFMEAPGSENTQEIQLIGYLFQWSISLNLISRIN